MSINVLLVDDHTIVRQGLKSLLTSEKDIEVTAEAANGLDAIRLARELAPEVILMDLSMPEMSGIETTRQILNDNPASRIIILSMVLDRACVMEALKAGAAGYVLKDCTSDELTAAIRGVMGGGTYLCREITELVIRDTAIGSGGPPNARHALLSRRELDALRLIAEGKNSKEIAFLFGISAKTADAQRLKIMKKLNVHSVAELTKYAVREGLTGIE
jgi:DNA-binding NarL/FixJ family response regulator